MDFAALKDWIGRAEESADVAAAGPLEGLAATLDHADPPWRPGEVPPLGHWLYFLPRARQSAIGADGHPRRGDFLPPAPLPRRMWAGGRIEFGAPLAIGEAVRRRSVVAGVEHRPGRSGDMVFVEVVHEIAGKSGVAVREAQDIVYRAESNEAAPAAEPAPTAAPAAEWSRTITPDPVLLFRYSALTFNGHRIHYDRPYAETIEGYPGLIVHGPLTAMLLVDLFLRNRPRAAGHEVPLPRQTAPVRHPAVHAVRDPEGRRRGIVGARSSGPDRDERGDRGGLTGART